MSQDLQIVNIDTFHDAKALMGDRFDTMIKYFVEDTGMYIAEIETALLERAIEKAVAPAHTIKSSAKQIGVERLSEIAKQIEQFCRSAEGSDDDFHELDRLYQELELELETVISLLNEIIG